MAEYSYEAREARSGQMNSGTLTAGSEQRGDGDSRRAGADAHSYRGAANGG